MSDGDNGNGSLNGKAAGGRRPLRVLEIIGNAIVGGMETYVANLIANMPRDEFEFVCICPYESPYTAHLRRLGCTVYITPIQDDPLWRSVEMSVEIVRQHKIDIIHANLANAQTLAGVVGRMTNTPTVATIHARNFWVQEVSVARLTHMNLILVCQEAQAQALALGIAPEKLSVIRNGVDTTRFDPGRDGAAFRESIGVPAEAMLVGFMGRISWEKGPDKFVQVAQRIRQALPDVHFAMTGEGAAEGEIVELIQRMGMGDRIHLAGLRRDVENVYPAYDLQIQTSRSEAMPLALLEGMASGLPVVAMAVGGVAEIVEGGTTGILVSPGDWPGVSSPYPGDWEGIAAAAIDLLRNPDRMKRMGAAGRTRIVELFDLRRVVEETGALFQKLVKPAVMKNGVWHPAPSVVRDKGEGRVRLKQGGNALAQPARLAAVRSVET